MKKIDGVWALAACGIGWSLGGIFLKNVSINSFATAGFRSIFAFITIAAVSKKLPAFIVKTENNQNDIKSTIYLWLAALAYALTMILFCLANKLTFAANAVLLQYTHPIWIVLFGPILLKEKSTKIDFLTVFGVFAGMILFFSDNIFGTKTSGYENTKFLGNIIALLSGVTFGFTTIFQRKQKADNSKNAFMLAQLITAFFGLPFIFFSNNGIPDSTSLIFLILLGCIQMGLPNISYAIGIKKVPALSAALITMIEPLMNPIWVFIFMKEIPSLFSLTGGLIILFCILGREVISRKH